MNQSERSACRELEKRKARLRQRIKRVCAVYAALGNVSELERRQRLEGLCDMILAEIDDISFAPGTPQYWG